MIISNVKIEVRALEIKCSSTRADTICGLSKFPDPGETRKGPERS